MAKHSKYFDDNYHNNSAPATAHWDLNKSSSYELHLHRRQLDDLDTQHKLIKYDFSSGFLYPFFIQTQSKFEVLTEEE